MVSSEGEAEQLICSILTEPDTRQQCLTVLAEGIEEANRHGRDLWAVRHTTEKVRLIVGHIIICTLANRPERGPIWMALDKGLLGASNSLLERSGDWEWDVDVYPEYPTIESRNGYYSPSKKHTEIWPTIRHLHFESISKAANKTTMDPRTPQGHSSEIFRYLRSELERHVPDPLY
jgi:hypothetical protein